MGRGKKDKKTQFSGFIIKNRLVKVWNWVKYRQFFCVCFVCFVFFVCVGFSFFWVFFYTSLVESPTNFKQRYANYVSLHSTASHTLPTARWQLLLNEEMITPFQRQAVPLCPEKKNELKIRSNNNNKKPRNTGGKELVGSWMELVGGLTRQARPAHTHTCDSHLDRKSVV